jgi:Rieske 2Fe-2S family protein
MLMTLLEKPESARPVYRLPREAYFDRAWFERERDLLFSRTWTFVGHETELLVAGDFITAEAGTEPVVVVRAADGTLRAFLNVCRHRGMVIACDAAGNCGEALRCGYHGWEYGLDGALLRVPQRRTQFPDLDAGTAGLLPVAVATWAGFVFVHPDPGAAGTFGRWLDDFPERCGDYPWAEMGEVARQTFEMQANWKLFVENHIDWLHLWYLHSDTVAGYDHHDGTYGDIGLHWWSHEQLGPAEAMYEPAGSPRLPGLSDDELRSVRANLLFPNVPFASVGTAVIVLRVLPTGPETTTVEIRWYALPDAVIADETRELFLQIVHEEDATACERMQRAVHSPRFEVGMLAVDHERPIERFHENLLMFLDAV